MNTIEIARRIVDVLEEKKGENILLLDIHEIAQFTDYFVLCTGTSDRMLDGLKDAVLDRIKQEYALNARLEGRAMDGWVLADYGDIIVHLFSPDQRDYYRLEDLWEKGKTLVHLQ